MSHRVTIHDVAREAGVSITAVSHGLNNKGTLSEKTRKRVRETAARLGYEPDPMARGLRNSPIGVIGLMLRPLDSLGTYRPHGVDYFTRLTGAVAVECLDRGLSVMLIRDLTQMPRSPLALSLDGYIVDDPLENDPVIDLLLELPSPFVTIGRDPARPDFVDWVGAHDSHDTEAVLSRFHRSGAQSIGLITGLDRNAWNLDSIATYRCWAATHNMVPRISSQPEAAGTDGGQAAIQELLAPGAVPLDAIYCLTGRHARGALEELIARGIAVPGHTQIIAGSDSEQSRNSSPAISAIDLEPELIASAAVEQLCLKIQGGRVKDPEQLKSRLILRDSTLDPQ